MAFTLGDAIVKIRGDDSALPGVLNRSRGMVRGFVTNMTRGIAQGIGQTVVGGVRMVVQGVGDGIAGAGQLKQVSGAFNEITKDIEGGADGMLQSLKDGSAQMVTNTELMKAYNKANSLVGQDFANRLPDAMKLLRKQAAATGEDMTFFTDSLVTGIGRMSPMILDNLGLQVSLADANAKYAESLGKTTEELTKEEQQIALMNEVMGQLKEKTADLPDVLDDASTKMTQFKTRVADATNELISKFLPGLNAGLDKAMPLLESMIPILMAWADQFINFAIENGPAIQEAFNQIWFYVSQLIDYVMLNGPTIINWIVALSAGFAAFSILTTIAGWIGAAIAAWGAMSAAFAAGSSVIGVIVALLGGPVTLVIAAIAALIAFLAVAWTNNWWDIQGKTAVALEAIQVFFQNFIANSKLVWSEFVAMIKALIQTDFVQSLIASYTQLFAAVTQIFAAFKAAFNGDWTAFWTQLKAATLSYLSAIAQIFGTLWGLISPLLTAAITNMKAAFNDVDWAGIGKNIIDGVRAGVSGAAASLAESMRGAAQNALNAAKSALGINSPSKVMMQQVGEPIVEGVEGPLKRGRGRIASAMQRMVQVPPQTAAAAASAFGTGGNSSTTHNNVGGSTINVYETGDAKLTARLIENERVATLEEALGF